MIKRVIGPDGDVWHDCDEAGCEVSWDGITIETNMPVSGRVPLIYQLDIDADKPTLVRIRRKPKAQERLFRTL